MANGFQEGTMLRLKKTSFVSLRENYCFSQNLFTADLKARNCEEFVLNDIDIWTKRSLYYIRCLYSSLEKGLSAMKRSNIYLMKV